jgi:hypothetical protein
VGAGAVSVQVTRHYFRLFAPPAGEPVNETAIAMWVATTPVFIYLVIAFLQLFHLNRGVLTGREAATVSWPFGVTVAVTVVALLRFEAVCGPAGPRRHLGRRHRQVVLLLASTVVYTLALSAALRPVETAPGVTLALLPLYWIGFAAGGRAALSRAERVAFRRNWRRLKRFRTPILVTELVAVFVFFSEFLALGGADPTLVNLVISSHVVVVFLASRYLARLRAAMEATGVRRVWVLGMRLSRRRLPEGGGHLGHQLAWLGVALVGLVGCVYLSG